MTRAVKSSLGFLCSFVARPTRWPCLMRTGKPRLGLLWAVLAAGFSVAGGADLSAPSLLPFLKERQAVRYQRVPREGPSCSGQPETGHARTQAIDAGAAGAQPFRPSTSCMSNSPLGRPAR